MNKKRYFVRSIKGVAMNTWMYSVFDVNEDKLIGEPTYWKADAEKKADRLNIKYEATTKLSGKRESICRHTEL